MERLLQLLSLLVIFSQVKCYDIQHNSNSSSVESLVYDLIIEMLEQNSQSQLVFLRDSVTREVTPLMSHLLKNHSQSMENILTLQWNNQIPPAGILLEGHIEYKFSWLDRPWRVVQTAGKFFYIVVISKDTFKSAMSYMASTISIEPSHHRFIFWFIDANEDETKQLLLHTYSSFFRFKLAIVVLSDNSIQLNTVCFFCNGGEPQVFQAGVFQHGIGLRPKSGYFEDLSNNMHGKQVRGSFFYPFARVGVREMQSKLQPVNFIEAYITDVMQYLNVEYVVEVYEIPPNATIDVENEDGSWHGQMGEVLYERALFGCGTSVNGPAMKIVEWPHVYTFPIMSYVTRTPRPTFGWYAITQPFAPEMWAAIFAAGCFGIVAFRLLLWLESLFSNPFYPRQPPERKWGYCLSYVFLPLIEENPPKVPTAHAARTFVAFWWAYSTIVTCAYDTKLIGFLAQPQLEFIPQSLRDLLNYPKWTIAVSAGIAAFFSVFTQASEMEHHHKVREQLSRTSTLQECLDRALAEDAVCLDLDAYLIPSSMLYVDKYGTYPFKVAEDETDFIMYASISVQRHSVIAPAIRNIGLHLHSSGLLDKYHKEFPFTCKLVGIRLSRQLDRHYDTKMELILEQMKGPLVLMVVIGWFLPLIVFIREIIVARKYKKDSKE